MTAAYTQMCFMLKLHHYPFLPLGAVLALVSSPVISFTQLAANHWRLGCLLAGWQLPWLHLDNYKHNFIDGDPNAANKDCKNSQRNVMGKAAD